MRKLALGSACASAHTWQKNFLASSVDMPCAHVHAATRFKKSSAQRRASLEGAGWLSKQSVRSRSQPRHTTTQPENEFCVSQQVGRGRVKRRTLSLIHWSQCSRPSKSRPPCAAHMGFSVVLSPSATCLIAAAGVPRVSHPTSQSFRRVSWRRVTNSSGKHFEIALAVCRRAHPPVCRSRWASW